MRSGVLGLAVLLSGSALAAQQTPQLDGFGAHPPTDTPNLLVIVLDDVGVDEVGAYGLNQSEVHTPVFDGLAAEGLLFRSMWVTPGCSPTRAMLLTGLYPHENGVGRAMGFEPSEGNAFELPVDTPTLADMLAPTHHTAAFGKWHLTLEDQSAHMHPLLVGFEHHAGAIDNFTETNGQTYTSYVKTVDGVPHENGGYATSETVDDALDWVHTQGAAPWFAWVAFQSAHAPYHAPPPELHGFALPPFVWQDKVLHMKAMVEAMDTEIGRLLDGLAPAVRARTLIVVLGDNGTPYAVTTPSDGPVQGKGSLYESGVRVPFLVVGPGVAAGAECEALVSGVDLLATLAEVAGVQADHSVLGHSRSLVPYFSDPELDSQRTWLYSERFAPNGFGPYWSHKRAARTARHKLIVFLDENGQPELVEFFDLNVDPGELVDLLQSGEPLTPGQQGAFDLLSALIESQGQTG